MTPLATSVPRVGCFTPFGVYIDVLYPSPSGSISIDTGMVPISSFMFPIHEPTMGFPETRGRTSRGAIVTSGPAERRSCAAAGEAAARHVTAARMSERCMHPPVRRCAWHARAVSLEGERGCYELADTWDESRNTRAEMAYAVRGLGAVDLASERITGSGADPRRCSATCPD